MPMITIEGCNLSQVDPWDGESGINIPPGEYAFEVTAATATSSKVKGTPQLEVHLKIIAGAETEIYNDKELLQWYVLTAKSAGRLRNFLDACNLACDANGAFDSDALVGAQLIGELVHEAYEKGLNPMTGEPDMRKTVRIKKERPLEVGFTGGQAAEEAAPEAAPAAPVVRAAAPSVAPLKRPAAVQPAAQTPSVFNAPRVAGAVLPKPGARAPIPAKR